MGQTNQGNEQSRNIAVASIGQGNLERPTFVLIVNTKGERVDFVDANALKLKKAEWETVRGTWQK